MRGRIVEHTLHPWISKLMQRFLAKQGSGERYWLGLSYLGPLIETKTVTQSEGADSLAHFPHLDLETDAAIPSKTRLW